VIDQKNLSRSEDDQMVTGYFVPLPVKQSVILSHHLRPLILAAVLLWLVNHSAIAEDRLDLTVGYYLEDNNRVEVWSPVLHWESQLTTTSIIRLQAVYDVVSGASPTGAPPAQRTREVTQTTKSTSYAVVTGPSGYTQRSVAQTTTSTETVLEPYGKPILPLQRFDDERFALNLDFEQRFGDWLLTPSVAYGTESDYNSLTGSLKLGRELNNKNTLLSAALSFGQDDVLRRAAGVWEEKRTREGLLGLTQVINRTTLLTVNGTFSHSEGFLDDQYKSAGVGGEIIPEKRPDERDKWILFLMLNKMIEPLNGSFEATYRFYTDTYGINAHTVGLTWFQKLGKNWVIAPGVRYYEQSAADFYAPIFESKPQHYSADYRLAKLASLTYGLKLIWKPSDKFQFNIGYDRYVMEGRDGGATPAENFPSANVFAAGVKVWF
jgi:hypothetical protein